MDSFRSFQLIGARNSGKDEFQPCQCSGKFDVPELIYMCVFPDEQALVKWFMLPPDELCPHLRLVPISDL